MHPFGAGSRKWCQKTHTSIRNHQPIWVPFFEFSATFRRLIFHRFFGCSLILNFRHFGAERMPERRFFGGLFGAIPRLVAKVRMKLPCRRQHRFRGFRPPKKRQIFRYFLKGSEGARGWSFLTLLSILGARRDPKRKPFEARERFFWGPRF